MMRRLPGDYDLLAKSANEYVQPKWSNSLENGRGEKKIPTSLAATNDVANRRVLENAGVEFIDGKWWRSGLRPIHRS
jgi:hypothetical protein